MLEEASQALDFAEGRWKNKIIINNKSKLNKKEVKNYGRITTH